MTTLTELPTPALVLDRVRLGENARRMRQRAAGLGVQLRPHVKTIKSVEALRHALPDVTRITVSTLAEAACFAAAGYRDILYAVGIVPAKLPRVAALRAAGAEISVVLDSLAAAQALAGQPVQGLPVLIEIDSGGGRGGLSPGAAALPAVAEAIAASGARVAGVMTHAGHSYGARDTDAIRAIARAERDAVVTAAGRLRQAGFPAPLVSLGSTPTALFAEELAGVTEMRPGVFFLMDLFQAGLGCCGAQDLALSVVASVVGLRPAEGLALIDAGALALSQDRSTGGQALDLGFGGVGPLAGPPWPGVRVERVHQEHGFVAFVERGLMQGLTIGSRLRVWPNHACMTAAAYPAYSVTDGDERVVAVWPRVNGW